MRRDVLAPDRGERIVPRAMPGVRHEGAGHATRAVELARVHPVVDDEQLAASKVADRGTDPGGGRQADLRQLAFGERHPVGREMLGQRRGGGWPLHVREPTLPPRDVGLARGRRRARPRDGRAGHRRTRSRARRPRRSRRSGRHAALRQSTGCHSRMRREIRIVATRPARTEASSVPRPAPHSRTTNRGGPPSGPRQTPRQVTREAAPEERVQLRARSGSRPSRVGRSVARGVVAQVGLGQRALHEASERDALVGGGQDLVAEPLDEGRLGLTPSGDRSTAPPERHRPGVATGPRLSSGAPCGPSGRAPSAGRSVRPGRRPAPTASPLARTSRRSTRRRSRPSRPPTAEQRACRRPDRRRR